MPTSQISPQNKPAKPSPPAANQSSNFRLFRRLGASGHGVRHWHLQRISALILVPLVLWLVTEIVSSYIHGYEKFRAAFHKPVVAFGMMLFFAFAYFHAYLGLETIYKDYIHNAKIRSFITIITLAVLGGFAIVSIFAIMPLYLS
ncbi:MAG: succinate dehydrogenase, hydrophobic membrane anchor protein [Alphaproteobacteria bacterium]|nr:succinate dehydrogenase, hydrophobic membrane anchor protein [Alphaproteobacteria bacterium]